MKITKTRLKQIIKEELDIFEEELETYEVHPYSSEEDDMSGYPEDQITRAPDEDLADYSFDEEDVLSVDVPELTEPHEPVYRPITSTPYPGYLNDMAKEVYNKLRSHEDFRNFPKGELMQMAKQAAMDYQQELIAKTTLPVR